jgi:hypothetical protein
MRSSAAITVTTILLLPLGGVLADRARSVSYRVTGLRSRLDQVGDLAALALSGQLSLPVVCISAVAPGVIHSFSIPPGFVLLPRYVAKEKLGPPSASAQPTLSSESSPHPQR